MIGSCRSCSTIFIEHDDNIEHFNQISKGGKSMSDFHLFQLNKHDTSLFFLIWCKNLHPAFLLSAQQNLTKKRDKLKSINLSLFLKIDAGIVLSSQEVALQVFSPLQVFTTVFGMGTGGLLAIGHQRILLHTLEIT